MTRLSDMIAARDDARRACRTYLIRGRPGHNDRPALAAGHPVTWGAITDGTVLDKEPYPFPVFTH